jgi:RNA polymerase sigma factor FliA
MQQKQFLQPKSINRQQSGRGHTADLVAGHHYLVQRIARQVFHHMASAIEIADLIQIGTVALIESAGTFEDRGIVFAIYASTRIRGAMIDQLRRDARISRTGILYRRQFAQSRKKLENRLMRQVTDSEMATEISLSLSAYQSMACSARVVEYESLDVVYSDHDILFADLRDAADSEIEKQQLRAVLADKVAQLSEREALILQLYFVDELDLNEIGRVLLISAARVCQIKKRAIERLRESMGSCEISHH